MYINQRARHSERPTSIRCSIPHIYDTVSQKESLKKQHFFWNCVDSLLKQEHFQAANATIFFTTDEPSLREVASEKLKVYGQTVKFNNKPVQHTSQIVPNIYTATMLDWYMFGWSSATVITGTSYAQSGIKRTHSQGHHRMALFLNIWKKAGRFVQINTFLCLIGLLQVDATTVMRGCTCIGIISRIIPSLEEKFPDTPKMVHDCMVYMTRWNIKLLCN